MGHTSLHRKTESQQQSAGPKNLGAFTIVNLDQGGQVPCSVSSKVKIPALTCPLSRPLSMELDKDVICWKTSLHAHLNRFFGKI